MALGGLASIGNIAARVILIISAAVIIGLSVNLRGTFDYYTQSCDRYNRDFPDRGYGDCGLTGWPPSSRYAIFVGVWGIVAAFVGFVPTFISSTAVFIAAVVLDALAFVFYLAGAITFTIFYNREGIQREICFFGDDNLKPTCSTTKTRIQADQAFMYIGFIISLFALATLVFVRRSN